MKIDLTGKLALVTGASGGIGMACVEALVAAGARVRVNARDAAALGELARRLLVESVPGDLSDPATLASLTPEGDEPDLLVHAAGHRFTYGKLHTETASDAAASFLVDYEAFASLARRSLPAMMGRRYGRIVAVTSLVSSMSGAGSARYVAIKSAVEGLVRGIAVDYGRYNITANAVAPGFVETSRLAARMSSENRARFEATTSAKRLARPEEIAAPILFLCSPLASYVTGTTLPVGGGAQLNNHLW